MEIPKKALEYSKKRAPSAPAKYRQTGQPLRVPAEVLQRQLDQIDLILVLSLDVTNKFSHELGIDSWYTIEVRDYCRGAIADLTSGKTVAEFLDVMIYDRLEPFFENIETSFCSPIASRFKQWFLDYPTLEKRDAHWGWEMLVRDLRNNWAKKDLPCPLRDPDSVNLRIQIRDYLCHSASIDKELALVDSGIDSSWDNSITEMKNGRSLDLLQYAINDIRDLKFWKPFLEELTPIQISELVAWAESIGQGTIEAESILQE